MSAEIHPQKEVIDSLEHLVHASVEPFIEGWTAETADKTFALLSFVRWIKATGNPTTVFAHLVSSGRHADRLFQIFGYSAQLTDVLVQNPELSSLLLDAQDLPYPVAAAVLSEGTRLLSVSQSTAHAQDQLRYLKQKWMLTIAAADLTSEWGPEKVWEAQSELASSLIELCSKQVADHLRAKIGGPEHCPITIVAFGKLGGDELNASSDVDLLFALDDEASEEEETWATRFAERLARALSDRMGRGSLYRVDLRLRPYGKRGPVVQRFRAIENYYEAYAEPWEVLALIRSKVIESEPLAADRWESLRNTTCFKVRRGDWFVEELMNNRIRSRELASSRDLKRCPGGIRDIEFTTQILQCLNGAKHETLKGKSTAHALDAMEKAGVVQRGIAGGLKDAYIELRQVEHRCQWIDDTQTHQLPADQQAKNRVAKSLGLASPYALEEALKTLHEHVIGLTDQALSAMRTPLPADNKAAALAKLSCSEIAARWIDSLPDSDAYYRLILDESKTLSIVEKFSALAPTVAADLSRDESLTERVLSGLWREDGAGTGNWAEDFRTHRILAAARWVIEPEFELGPELTTISDQALTACFGEANLNLVALGSFASQDLSLGSDMDAIFFVEKADEQPLAEQRAQKTLAEIQAAKIRGTSWSLDLRLRPEGKKGALVSSLDAWRTYASTKLESWERLALSKRRMVIGSENAMKGLNDALGHPRFDAKTLHELLGMKKRIETERVAPQEWSRQCKLGFGGVDDIEWLIQLNVLSHESSWNASPTLKDRLHRMVEWQALSKDEASVLEAAHAHHRAVRNALFLLGYDADLVPENPDKLDRLAATLRMENGYAFDREDRALRSAVRSIYEDGIRKLVDQC